MPDCPCRDIARRRPPFWAWPPLPSQLGSLAGWERAAPSPSLQHLTHGCPSLQFHAAPCALLCPMPPTTFPPTHNMLDMGSITWNQVTTAARAMHALPFYACLTACHTRTRRTCRRPSTCIPCPLRAYAATGAPGTTTRTCPACQHRYHSARRLPATCLAPTPHPTAFTTTYPSFHAGQGGLRALKTGS